MSVTVVDASVAAKWYLGDASELLRPEAQEILNRYARGEMRFVVPNLFLVEVANVLWKAARRGRISQSNALEALTSLKKRNIPTVSSTDLLHLALGIAMKFNRSVYDSLYVALAIESNGQFVTADQKLVNALSAHCPVRWLGGF